jgi:hypothetical protein
MVGQPKLSQVGLGENNGDLLESDFWPAMTSGLPVIPEWCRCGTRLNR